MPFPQQEYGLPRGSLKIAISFRVMRYIGDSVFFARFLHSMDSSVIITPFDAFIGKGHASGDANFNGPSLAHERTHLALQKSRRGSVSSPLSAVSPSQLDRYA
jgi:hypothetical protein